MMGFWKGLYRLARRHNLPLLKTVLCNKQSASRQAPVAGGTYDQGISLYQNPPGDPNQMAAVNHTRRLRGQLHWLRAKGPPLKRFSIQYQTHLVNRLSDGDSDHLRDKQLSDSSMGNSSVY